MMLMQPILWLRKFSNIAIFSAVVSALTAMSFAIIAYINIQVLQQPLAPGPDDFQVDLTEEDRQYTYWNLAMLPTFAS